VNVFATTQPQLKRQNTEQDLLQQRYKPISEYEEDHQSEPSFLKALADQQPDKDL
jgi:hypothetical protein